MSEEMVPKNIVVCAHVAPLEHQIAAGSPCVVTVARHEHRQDPNREVFASCPKAPLPAGGVTVGLAKIGDGHKPMVLPDAVAA